MDDNGGLKSSKTLPKEPQNLSDKLDYRLSMSLKQPEDNYVVDELFRNGTITIYALYDVDRKLAKPAKGNREQIIGDGSNFLENERVQSTVLYENSNFKKIRRASSEHIEGEKSEKKIQTDFLECKENKSEDLKILYSRHFNGRQRNDNAIIKKKIVSGENLWNGRIISNAAVKKFESNLVKVPEEPECESRMVEEEILEKKKISKTKKELKISENQIETDLLIDQNVQNCVLNDMKYLQLQISRIITKLEKSKAAINSNPDLTRKKSVQKQEVTVRLSMEREKSGVVLTGSVFSISEEPKKSNLAIEISSKVKILGNSKSESSSNSVPFINIEPVKKCLSFDQNVKLAVANFRQKKFSTSVLIHFECQMTKAIVTLESYNEYNKIYIEIRKIEDNKKYGKIPVFKPRNILSKSSRTPPWNSSTQRSDLYRKNFKIPVRKEIHSKQSIDMDPKKKSISTIKRTTDQIPSVKVIHSNKSYLELLKASTGTNEIKSRRAITPRTSCCRDRKSFHHAAKQSLREVPNSNYIILPHAVYEKVIFVRNANSKDEVSSEFDESLSGRDPSCSCILASKSEESQPPIKTSKDEIILTGKQSLPEIKIRKNEFLEIKKRNSEEKQKNKSQLVRSVWALTKVLIFDDGSKKMEVLEASCTPLWTKLMQINKAEG